MTNKHWNYYWAFLVQRVLLSIFLSFIENWFSKAALLNSNSIRLKKQNLCIKWNVFDSQPLASAVMWLLHAWCSYSLEPGTNLESDSYTESWSVFKVSTWEQHRHNHWVLFHRMSFTIRAMMHSGTLLERESKMQKLESRFWSFGGCSSQFIAGKIFIAFSAARGKTDTTFYEYTVTFMQESFTLAKRLSNLK